MRITTYADGLNMPDQQVELRMSKAEARALWDYINVGDWSAAEGEMKRLHTALAKLAAREKWTAE